MGCPAAYKVSYYSRIPRGGHSFSMEIYHKRVPPDLETLINKRLSSGGFASVEDVLRPGTSGCRGKLDRRGTQSIVVPYRGRLPTGRKRIDAAQARREIRVMKDNWLH